MRQLNGVYTQAYNWRHHRVGHIFQGRYKAILVDKDSYLLEVCRYVVLNPIRARAIRRPEQWRWSSYRATASVGQSHPCLTVDWVLSQFSERAGEARRRYRDFVEDGMAAGTIYEHVKGQIFLGDEEFISKLERTISRRDEIREIPREQRYADRPQLSTLFAAKRLKVHAKARAAVERYGFTQKEIADHLGLHYSTISRWLSSGNSRFKT